MGGKRRETKRNASKRGAEVAEASTESGAELRRRGIVATEFDAEKLEPLQSNGAPSLILGCQVA